MVSISVLNNFIFIRIRGFFLFIFQCLCSFRKDSYTWLRRIMETCMLHSDEQPKKRSCQHFLQIVLCSKFFFSGLISRNISTPDTLWIWFDIWAVIINFFLLKKIKCAELGFAQKRWPFGFVYCNQQSFYKLINMVSVILFKNIFIIYLSFLLFMCVSI